MEAGYPDHAIGVLVVEHQVAESLRNGGAPWGKDHSGSLIGVPITVGYLIPMIAM